MRTPTLPLLVSFPRFFRVLTSVFLLLILCSCHKPPAQDPNVLSVTIGRGLNTPSQDPYDINIPTGSVSPAPSPAARPSIISSSTQHPPVFGSSPRYFLKPPLPIAEGGGRLFECLSFNTSNLWGEVAALSVKIGDEHAIPELPVQILGGVPKQDKKGSPLPNCAKDAPSRATDRRTGFNGILGVSPFSLDHDLYYSCREKRCRITEPPKNKMVQNPIRLLPRDNNGIILDLPPVSYRGSKTRTGKLLMGIGTRENNMEPERIDVYSINDAGAFRVLIGKGPPLFAQADMATNFIAGPVSGIKTCTGSLSNFLCPSAPSTLPLTIWGSGGGPRKMLFLSVGNARDLLLKRDRTVFDNLVYVLPSSPVFELGIPFFLGRKVYLEYGNQSGIRRIAF